MKISVNKIHSEEGLLAIREVIKTVGRKSLSTGLEILETQTNITWEQMGVLNGNSFDLWLRKKGTLGSTSKTFKRIYLKEYSDIATELKFKGLPISQNLLDLVATEKQEAEALKNSCLELIANFNDVEQAQKWISKTDGNAHSRRTKWANRAERLGMPRYFGNNLRDRCYQIIN